MRKVGPQGFKLSALGWMGVHGNEFQTLNWFGCLFRHFGRLFPRWHKWSSAGTCGVGNIVSALEQGTY